MEAYIRRQWRGRGRTDGSARRPDIVAEGMSFECRAHHQTTAPASEEPIVIEMDTERPLRKPPASILLTG